MATQHPNGATPPAILADCFLTTAQVCQLLQISRATLRRWEEKGVVSKGVRPANGHLRYSAAQLEADVAAGRLKLPGMETGGQGNGSRA